MATGLAVNHNGRRFILRTVALPAPDLRSGGSSRCHSCRDEKRLDVLWVSVGMIVAHTESASTRPPAARGPGFGTSLPYPRVGIPTAPPRPSRSPGSRPGAG
jgi:hypothetical protein